MKLLSGIMKRLLRGIAIIPKWICGIAKLSQTQGMLLPT
jgi:hypothetical protein